MIKWGIKYCFLLIPFVSLLCSCKQTQTEEQREELLRVNDHVLRRSEIKALIPYGISSADSLLFSDNLEKKWVKEHLVLDVALLNLNKEDKKEVDKLVEEYRRSLIRYRYQEQLLKEKLSAAFSEDEKKQYYEENQDKFILDRALLRGLFLKIPIDAPGLSDVKKWYKVVSEESVEKIEKYSIQNAAIYDYFYDKWVDFDRVIDNLPVYVSNANEFLKTHRSVEVSDSTYCYLLNIKEYLKAGSVAPYEYVDAQIVEMLTNRRKIDFLKKFEDDLYNDAVKNGDVEFYSEP